MPRVAAAPPCPVSPPPFPSLSLRPHLPLAPHRRAGIPLPLAPACASDFEVKGGFFMRRHWIYSAPAARRPRPARPPRHFPRPRREVLAGQRAHGLRRPSAPPRAPLPQAAPLQSGCRRPPWATLPQAAPLQFGHRRPPWAPLPQVAPRRRVVRLFHRPQAPAGGGQASGALQGITRMVVFCHRRPLATEYIAPELTERVVELRLVGKRVVEVPAMSASSSSALFSPSG